MRKLLLCIMLVAPALLPQVSASATTEHCPDGWMGKRELAVETDTIFLGHSGLHCFKYGTEATGIIFTRRGPWTTPNGKGISYYVCYMS